MLENTDKILRSEDLYNQFLDLKNEQSKLEDQKTKIEFEKSEIDNLKNSVEYLKLVYEKNKLTELVEEGKSENEESLKVHLYAAKFQVSQLKSKLSKLNDILSISPYVYALVNLKNMKMEWISENVKLFGYSSRALRNESIDVILKDSNDSLCIRDGFILNHPLKKADNSVTWVDLHFNLDLSSDDQLALLTFHEVKERFESS